MLDGPHEPGDQLWQHHKRAQQCNRNCDSKKFSHAGHATVGGKPQGAKRSHSGYTGYQHSTGRPALGNVCVCLTVSRARVT